MECCISFVSYIKPQLHGLSPSRYRGCISFVSYIKPQPTSKWYDYLTVVYRSFPTSNHNCLTPCEQFDQVVYRSFPTSNHNTLVLFLLGWQVVYRSFPTSNHNTCLTSPNCTVLYIVRFLHQTTTLPFFFCLYVGCISFVSYIKPQLSPSLF